MKLKPAKNAWKAVMFAAIAVLLAGLIILLSMKLQPPTLELEMQLNVSNVTGFNVNTSAVTFGEITPGAMGARDVIITNEDNYDKNAHFEVAGPISEFVKAPADTLAKADANTSARIEAHVPPATPYGEYNGVLRIFLTKAI